MEEAKPKEEEKETTIAPVLEVRTVKILEEYGLEMSILSFVNPANTSYVVISRETEHFVNEIHDHKEELRSSNKLLTDFQKSERRELYGEERGSNSIKETCVPKGNKETCANPLSNLIIDSLFKKTVIPTSERKWITIAANPSPRKGLPTQVSKVITKMIRHHDQEER